MGSRSMNSHEQSRCSARHQPVFVPDASGGCVDISITCDHHSHCSVEMFYCVCPEGPKVEMK